MSVVCTSLAGAASAAPAPLQTPLLQQSLVGLRQGAQGDDVKAVQNALIAAGIRVVGGADGAFGPATRSALIDFQSKNGLEQSGEVDDATASALGLAGGNAAAAETAAAPSSVSGLQQGASGEEVKDLQRKLSESGVFVPGGADGSFGPGTATAVSNFQRWNGLTISGVVDAATAGALGLGAASSAPAAAPATATAAATTDTNPYVGLKLGAGGALVKDLQSALIGAGVNVRGGADGSFGNATKSALASYQQANGLTASGEVDSATAGKLPLGSTAATPAPAAATPAPAATSDNKYVGLSVGAQGSKVKELQVALQGTGLVVRGGADGSFGNATKTALIAFQSVNGIEQTGVLTEKGAGILALGAPAASAAAPAQATGLASTAEGFAQKGESSERVRLTQQLLIDWGISVSGGADGSFGNATAAAISGFQKAHGLAVSGTITQATADKMGLSPSSATPAPPELSIVLKRFPLQGQCYFGNTWHAPRGNGRLHKGVDLIAEEGKLLYAVTDGTITKQYWDQPGKLSGNGLRLAEDNGTYYTYLHMSDFAPGIEVGVKVKAGDVIGFVGNTGSSATSHLHFEIHPGGGAAVNPYPYVQAVDDCGNTTPQYQSSFA